jgi:hypothetical protein
MPLTIARVLGAIALVIAAIVLVRVVFGVFEGNANSPSQPAHSSQAPAAKSTPATPSTSPVQDARSPTTPHAAARTTSPTHTTEPPLVPGATPIVLEVSAPPSASALDPFEVRVRISAPAGAYRIRFAVTYDRKTLELTGVTQGDFAQRSGLRADFATDEPSDGNLEVTFTGRDGQALIGAGTVAILHFAPRRSGTVRIAVPNLTAFDSSGAVRFQADEAQSATVNIH